MCTRVLWNDNGQAVLVGRNMDWVVDMRSNLWALPAGIERTGLADDPNPLTWTSRYGSVVTSTYDTTTADGINTAGLGAHLLWLSESDYGTRDTKRPGVAMAIWLQWALDTCGSAAEVVAALQDTNLQVVAQQDENSGRSSTLHLAVEDATGDSAVVEYLDGKLVVHHGDQYVVLTNSPPYDEQLAGLSRYAGFGGDLPLPGTTEAADRFVRAAYYLQNLPKPDTSDLAVAELASVMRNTAQPFGHADPARPNISTTQWQTITDLSNLVYMFSSSLRPNPVWVHLDPLDLEDGDPVCMVDLVNDRYLIGDVTVDFMPAAPFTFTTDTR